jgi:ribosomal protein S18 acetylase RimI-like enzyme
MQVERVLEATDEVVDALGRLIPQLGGGRRPPSSAEVEAVVASAGSLLLLARDAAGVVGTLTLNVHTTPGGRRAWINDVVVDTEVRGRGAGRALVGEAVRLAREAGAFRVSLTSHPGRAAAHRLYEAAGFKLVETRVYRIELGSGS